MEADAWFTSAVSRGAMSRSATAACRPAPTLRPSSIRPWDPVYACPTGRGRPSPQPAVLRACFLDTRNIRVGVLPQDEEILVCAFRLYGIARKRERSSQLKTRHRVHRIDEDDASVIENPLEFGGR